VVNWLFFGKKPAISMISGPCSDDYVAVTEQRYRTGTGMCTLQYAIANRVMGLQTSPDAPFICCFSSVLSTVMVSFLRWSLPLIMTFFMVRNFSGSLLQDGVQYSPPWLRDVLTAAPPVQQGFVEELR
jgi:hypothetical protein